MIGLTHIYCGDGKGKTTAAIGLGVRACGCGLKVLMVQFLKSNTSSERYSLCNLPNFTVLDAPEKIKFTFQMTEQEMQQASILCKEQFEQATHTAIYEKYNLLIFDEIFGALSCKLLEEADILTFLKKKPADLELVLTGRNPPQDILDLADYISEIKCRKHPYEKGISARKGIEF